MGADGHVQFVVLHNIPVEFDDLVDRAEELTGWKRKSILGGAPFLWSYWDTEKGDSGYSLADQLDSLEDEQRSRQVRTQASGLTYVEYYTNHIDTHGGMELAKRARDFKLWLEANAEDWEVWT